MLEAPGLLRIMWADPQHAAEHLAVWSLARFGPRAESAVAKLRSRDPVPTRDELEQLVVTRQTRVVMTEGAFVGGPFVFLMAVAFCAALLGQAQMVYELAAAADRSPTDRLRAAELLVLLGAYSSTGEALQALADTAGRRKRSRRQAAAPRHADRGPEEDGLSAAGPRATRGAKPAPGDRGLDRRRRARARRPRRPARLGAVHGLLDAPQHAPSGRARPDLLLGLGAGGRRRGRHARRAGPGGRPPRPDASRASGSVPAARGGRRPPDRVLLRRRQLAHGARRAPRRVGARDVRLARLSPEA